MYIKILLSMCLCSAFGEQQNKINQYKDQYCTDPRTMKKHVAYTEWADAYSCTRHRCQPGGRNLAIYTVGCKRVEAPESAIECEEVVEDTNIQFPYCCTRLRCLVVVRGEVWTKVLGQPWETLPAAPWSHMYKMKKPPPGELGFVPKSNGEGPIFELASDVAARENRAGTENKNLLSTYHSQDSAVTEDCEKASPRAVPSPDIVIALTTSNKGKDNKEGDSPKVNPSERKPYSFDDGNDELEKIESEVEDHTTASSKQQAVSWTEIPQNQWKDDAPTMESHEVVQKKPDEKAPGFNLQSLVDAIGTRMRDIEDVVQKMSDKVHQGKKKLKQDEGSLEKSFRSSEVGYKEITEIPMKAKSPNPESDNYKRFATRPHTKYRSNDISTEKSLYAEESNVNGYFSDSSNNGMRRSPPKEPSQPTYMVPIEPQRRNMLHSVAEVEDNVEKKKKRKHKRKKTKPTRGHKKTRRKDSKLKKGKKSSNSMEIDTANIVSLEDSALIAS